MSRLLLLLTCFLLIASAQPSHAAAQDSPGTIYIDGVPCNLPCQSYMAWSRQVLSQHATPGASRAARPAHIAQPPAKPRAQRVARLPVPRPNVMAPAVTTADAPARAAAAPAVAEPQPPREEAKVPPAAPETGNASAPVADAPAKEAPEATTSSVPSDAAAPAPTATAALPPPDSPGEMVAILLVRPDITSASDLANKVVAVDEAPAEYSVSEVKTAMVAAGASGVQLVENKTAALVRIIDGEVQAAIVSVLSAKAADAWNGGLSGFKVLRIRLPLHSETQKRG